MKTAGSVVSGAASFVIIGHRLPHKVKTQIKSETIGEALLDSGQTRVRLAGAGWREHAGRRACRGIGVVILTAHNIEPLTKLAFQQ